jgi:hypothetical protein
MKKKTKTFIAVFPLYKNGTINWNKGRLKEYKPKSLVKYLK